MPPVRRVEATADGLLIETATSVVFELTWVRAGNQVTFTLLRNGVQRRQQTINTPSAAQVESWVTDNLNPELESRFGVRLHVYDLNPLRVAFLCINAGDAIPATWWPQL